MGRGLGDEKQLVLSGERRWFEGCRGSGCWDSGDWDDLGWSEELPCKDDLEDDDPPQLPEVFCLSL